MCDQGTTECLCKENVEGQSCATCKAGTFHLDEADPLGCTPCFCFGTTDQCSSAYWAKADQPLASTPDQPWTLRYSYSQLSSFTLHD